MSVDQLLQNGTLDENSLMLQTPGIGHYLNSRLRRAFAPVNSLAPFTLKQFWDRTRNMSSDRLTTKLKKALQNARSNQCVPSSPRRVQSDDTYHVGDINQRGYDACIALLRHQRNRRTVAYGPLPTLPARSRSTKTCGCKSKAKCQTDASCRWTSDACVPRSHNARGFVGVPPLPEQGPTAADAVDRARVRRRSRVRRSTSYQRDPWSSQDIRAGHSRSLSYTVRGNRMWRKPGRRIRLPVQR